VPQAQTVQFPKKLPLIAQAGNRDSTTLKDAKLVNCYAERREELEGYIIEKRFGMTPQSDSVDNETGRGILPFGTIASDSNLRVQPPILTTAPSGQIHVWGWSGTVLFKTWQVIATLAGGQSTTVSVGVIPATPSQGAQYILGFGTTAYVNSPSTGAGFVPITDPNYPAGTVAGFVYLDGTLYVMSTAGAIFGSLNLNDPFHWDPLNVIFAQAEPDIPVMLAKQLTYIVAIKSTSTQFFYDAGNPTGSPLAPVPGALVNYGCISADTVQSIDDLLLWVTSNIDATPQVLLLKNLAPTIISTPAIERLLEAGNANDQYISFSFKLAGHKFYGFSNIQANLTLVYDIGQNLWYEWTDADGNYYPVMAVQVSTPFSVTPQVNPASLVVQLRTTGQTYIMQPDYQLPTDNGIVFAVDIITPNFDGGTDRRKTMNAMWINADQTKGSYLKVRYSDNDYKSWTNWREFNLGINKPMLTQFGTFTKRAHHFRHECNTPFRAVSVGMQLDIGTL
jgi:hypothetical protein